MSARTDWAIVQRSMWVATHTSGATLVARSREALMRKINEFDQRRAA